MHRHPEHRRRCRDAGWVGLRAPDDPLDGDELASAVRGGLVLTVFGQPLFDAFAGYWPKGWLTILRTSDGNTQPHC